MSKNLFKFDIKTEKAQQMIDITHLLRQAIEQSEIREGIAVVYCPHTTAGLTINENGDPDVVRDIIEALNRVFPVNASYRHFEGNSHAHIKSSLVGVEKNIIISEGKPVLGTWQSLYFCEFDGPRRRNLFIKIIEMK
ncbi:secondary thiamine-phosphate synthase enzyme YjbQ [Thermosyntropha sp.]|uniref:secondary thiamine-phosphate synthase enzyme YjbQ n=1 Tax=Thermosyntropha sp. TaxID=2740820 RepID=UPI0025F1C8D5|nr:secondary thiamine-phosphate synthase enzyme YjbQ [Thermosyntropha sp.]MBO8159719.1 YjbQ family protein [Thermosyntropha sp.]